MATIKSYTDIEQSKKLAEILPLESSDGYWDFQIDGYKLIADELGYYKNDSEIPCWSLAALLKLIPNFNMFKRTIECRIETTNHLVDKACEPIDAAFEMICWLKEHNKI